MPAAVLTLVFKNPLPNAGAIERDPVRLARQRRPQRICR
jgi:hypothetical protein